MFPLGGLMKNEVRDIARIAKLPSAQRKDSQGICFLGKSTIMSSSAVSWVKRRGYH